MNELLSIARALIGTAKISGPEQAVLEGIAPDGNVAKIEFFRDEIIRGNDPLGSAYCLLNSPNLRRPHGQTFTPDEIVEGMVEWVARQSRPYARIVDPGAGSGRFTFAVLRRFSRACAIAVEHDPVLAVILRANANVLGLAGRVEIVVDDFRKLALPAIEGPTLFVGNPPYVRHHDIDPQWKAWYSDRLRQLGHGNSQLAGLHVYFFLKVLELARVGDTGCFITAAEWLDVNYGKALRDLLSNGLGGKAVYAVAPELRVFEDALVSAAITCFAPGSDHDVIRFKRVGQRSELCYLDGGRPVATEVARAESRWSMLFSEARPPRRDGFVALGDLFQVKRGQVTGLNRVWVAGARMPRLPQRFLTPCVTDAADISGARDRVISSLDGLRRVVNLPATLDELSTRDRDAIEAFLRWARDEGAADGYIARHRRPWWKVNLADPAPIVMTYMGRRPPVFALNKAGARLINVAHGLYPKRPLSEHYIHALVNWLNDNVSTAQGRAYAGGLIKFEPSEVMRLEIPSPTMLVPEGI